MNVLDIILGILLLLGLVRGFFNGFFGELAGLIALIAGVYAAIYFSDGTLGFLQQFLDWEPEYLALIAFALTFILIVVAISLLGGLLTKMVNLIALGLVNRLLGGVFGLVKIAFLISVFFMFLSHMNFMFVGQESRETSIIYPHVAKIGPLLLPTVMDKLNEEGIFEGLWDDEPDTSEERTS